MAKKILLKRSNVAGKVPATTDLDLGELGYNSHSGKLYAKKNDGADSIEYIGGGKPEWDNEYQNDQIKEIIPMLSPTTLIGDAEDRFTEDADMTPITVTAVSGTTITLNMLPRDFFKAGLKYGLKRRNPEGYAEVVSFDFANTAVTILGDAPSVGNKVAFYCQAHNLQWLPGQENAGLDTLAGPDPSWKVSELSAMGSWYDYDNSRFIVLVGYGNALGLGYIESPDLVNWQYGNSSNAILEFNDSTLINSSIWGSGTYATRDTIYFLLNTKDSGGDWVYLLAHSPRNSPESIVVDSQVQGLTPGKYWGGDIQFYNGEWHILTQYVPDTVLNNRTMRHFSSPTREGTYTLLNEFGNAWNNSVIHPGQSHNDTNRIFEENGNLYSLLGGTNKLDGSINLGNREIYVMGYDELNNVWTELSQGIVFQSLWGLGGNYAWANDHSGGYPSFVKKDGAVYLFTTMKGYAPVGYKLVNTKNYKRRSN